MPAMTTSAHRHSSVWTAAALMVGLSLALFFAPAINGLIAGAVGGYLVGSASRAMTAAILPAVIVAAGLWMLFSLMGLPFVGLVAGGAMTLWIVLSEVGLFLGALLGGAAHQALYHPR